MRILNFIIFFFLSGCTSRNNSTTIALDLSNQKLLVIPDSVFLLTELKYLNLGNSFTIYPPLSALASEDEGADSMNQITQIPIEIGQLRHLKVLSLCANDLRSLPKEIIKLERLDTLDISFNTHFPIAAELKTLKKMHWLRYINIVATNADQASIDDLRKSLPRTKIVATPGDMIKEISQ